MRIIITFIIGLVSFFYLSELFTRLLKKPLHSSFGLILILLGIAVRIFFHNYSPLDSLFLVFMIGSGAGTMIHHLLSQRFILSERLERNFYQKHEAGVIRFMEMIPGIITWLALTSPIWLSFTLPFAVAYLIILCDIYWLVNSLKIAILIVIGYRRIKYATSQNWLKRLEAGFPQEWGNYYHLLVLPTYKEPLEVLGPAFDAIVDSNYPKKKIFLAVGFEERDDPKKIEETTNYLKKYSQKIGGVFTTIHPFGLEGEVPGPGSNRNFMLRNAAKEFTQRGIKQDQVFVTTLDADFVIHKDFLPGALYKYLDTPSEIRDKRTYTGSFLYYNNYWQCPTPMRLMAVGTAFWQLAEMVGSDKYMNFSSLSINLKSLMEIGLWMPDKVNDDSGFFWKAYYHFKGDYKVIPHFLPIYGDAVLDTTLFKTYQNAYLQIKRWAYGVEHLPYVFIQYFRRDDIDFWDKTDKLLFVLWSNFKWGTLALFITFGGLLIPVVNPHYSQSVLSVNLPTISSWILDGAFLGLFSTLYVHEKTVPKRPTNWNIFQRIWSYIQWLLVPIILVTISTLPAIDAQTTLMFGKHLEFRVTNKARAKA